MTQAKVPFVTICDSRKDRFSDIVGQYLERGYVPCGGVSTTHSDYCISLILPEFTLEHKLQEIDPVRVWQKKILDGKA